jgi:hypothetical protein
MTGELRKWIEARARFHLSHAHIQMARELGMNPKNFGSLANQRQEPWKAPLPQFIENLYFKRFRKSQPDRVLSIEERAREIDRKKAEKNNRNSA